MDKDVEKYTAIEKALAILELFAMKNQELSTAEIGRMLEFHKATVSRTLLLLKKHNFLEQNENTKKYKLGYVIADLGLSVSNYLKNDFIQISKPYLYKLRDELQETVALEVLSGRNTVLAHVAEGPRRVRLAANVGMLIPTANASAGAKAILAFVPPEEWDNYLNADPIDSSPNRITDRDLFYKELERIKKTRIAFDIEEYDLDLIAVASPVFNMEGIPVAAVVAAGPTNRIGKKLNSQVAKKVKKTSEEISKQLYYVNHTPSSIQDWLKSIKVED